MDNHVLVLHIGTPKTGTTALQSFLYKNNEVLKQYGWCYPDIYKDLDSVVSCYREGVNGLIFYEGENQFDIQSKYWDKIWNYLKGELKKNNVILSAEDIYEWGNSERLLEAIKLRYDNLKVIIYLRRQDMYVESYWNEMIKENWVQHFETSFKEIAEKKYAHYLPNLIKIREVVGNDQLIVRVYEKNQFRGTRQENLFSDFFDAIGLEPVWADFEEVGILNERLCGNYIELRRVFNSLKEIDEKYINNYKRYFRKASDIFFEGNYKEEGYFTKEERVNFLGDFKEENEIIAEQFLQRKERVLFYDNNLDIPIHKMEKASAFEEDMIRLFSTIICKELTQLKQRINFLENKNRILENIADFQKENKKIAYWGAGQRCRYLLDKYNFDVKIIIDNDQEKAGGKINDILIFSPKEIINWNELLIIITCVETDKIEKQLKNIGLIKGNDFLLANDFL